MATTLHTSLESILFFFKPLIMAKGKPMVIAKILTHSTKMHGIYTITMESSNTQGYGVFLRNSQTRPKTTFESH